VKGNQAFDWIGSSAFFSGAPGQLRYTVQADGVHLFGDVNGDRRADFEIVLDGLSDLPIGPPDYIVF
jgi:hypothetical protein